MYELDDHIIGLNAGKIWKLLSTQVTLTKHQICNKENLSESAFHEALGWLARENKIRKDGEFFRLGETNLTEKIGENAGIVLKVLCELPYSVTPIHDLVVMTEHELHQALGWLAREGKLEEFFTSPDILTLDETEEKLIAAEEDNKQLNEEVKTRNQVINNLTMQLTERQTEFIKKIDVADNLNMKLAENDRQIQSTLEELQIAHTHIHELNEEVLMLSDDLLHRNQIIQELSKQVTDHQNMLIERTDALERLQCMASSIQQPLIASTDIQDRIHRVQSVQKELHQPLTQQINDFTSETRLFNNTTPSLEIQTHETICHKEEVDNIDTVHHHVDLAINERKQSLIGHGRK
jgi:hypothetical protein